MGNKEVERAEDDIASALFGKTRREVLALLYGNPDSTYYVMEIIGYLRLGRGSVQRELSRLSQAGLLVRSRKGNQVLYQANRNCPVYDEIWSLMVKTTGVATAIAEALSPLEAKIEAAFIFGSFATGEATAESDVDVAVIGSTTFREVSSELSKVQTRIAREVNPTVYSASEYSRKVKSGHHFVKAIDEGQKLFMIGSEDELRAMG